MLKPNVVEPSLTSFSNPLTCYFAATRPAFLFATFAACLLGLVSGSDSVDSLHLGIAAFTILLALLVHAAVNVLNDYFDALNGADALNMARLYPFTGGSRFIQNGLLTTKQTAYFGYVLLFVAILGGLWLSWLVGVRLLIVGAIGVLIGWAYSATPLRMNSRGFGELCVLAGFLDVTIGADLVQRQVFSLQPIIIGMPYALLVTNLLYINQFPDRQADMLVGKRHLVARLPLEQAVMIYPLLAILAFAWLIFFVYIKALPMLSMLSALPLLFSVRAAWMLKKYAATPCCLLPAIQLTLAAMLSHALLLALVIIWKMP